MRHEATPVDPLRAVVVLKEAMTTVADRMGLEEAGREADGMDRQIAWALLCASSAQPNKAMLHLSANACTATQPCGR